MFGSRAAEAFKCGMLWTIISKTACVFVVKLYWKFARLQLSVPEIVRWVLVTAYTASDLNVQRVSCFVRRTRAPIRVATLTASVSKIYHAGAATSAEWGYRSSENGRPTPKAPDTCVRTRLSFLCDVRTLARFAPTRGG